MQSNDFPSNLCSVSWSHIFKSRTPLINEKKTDFQSINAFGQNICMPKLLLPLINVRSKALKQINIIKWMDSIWIFSHFIFQQLRQHKQNSFANTEYLSTDHLESKAVQTFFTHLNAYTISNNLSWSCHCSESHQIIHHRRVDIVINNDSFDWIGVGFSFILFFFSLIIIIKIYS